jgi:hypothetical protein
MKCFYCDGEREAANANCQCGALFCRCEPVCRDCAAAHLRVAEAYSAISHSQGNRGSAISKFTEVFASRQKDPDQRAGLARAFRTIPKNQKGFDKAVFELGLSLFVSRKGVTFLGAPSVGSESAEREVNQIIRAIAFGR